MGLGRNLTHGNFANVSCMYYCIIDTCHIYIVVTTVMLYIHTYILVTNTGMCYIHVHIAFIALHCTTRTLCPLSNKAQEMTELCTYLYLSSQVDCSFISPVLFW